MPHSLYITPCRMNPPHHHHPPPMEKPLRINIEGPLVSVQKLLPDVPWDVRYVDGIPLQAAAQPLAELTFRAIYGDVALANMKRQMVVREEALGWIHEKEEIDTYGVAFDNNVPSDDYFPEVLQINIVEIEADNGEYANEVLPFKIDPAEYIGKKIFAIPRCCQNRKGSTDRKRVNGFVAQKEVIRDGIDQELMMKLLLGHGVYKNEKVVKKRFDVVPRPPTRPLTKGASTEVSPTEAALTETVPTKIVPIDAAPTERVLTETAPTEAVTTETASTKAVSTKAAQADPAQYN